MSTLLFVYGTLKRGCTNHRFLEGQAFVGTARTPPGFRLFDFGGYPGIVAMPDDRDGVMGEVWSVDDAALTRLDRFEGVHEGLYRREPLALMPPFNERTVFAYVSELSPEGRREVGSCWEE
jgi:gamma-glutamylcyclotransferase (GGCT)/AIG2-like uncharacterized protein YtfP